MTFFTLASFDSLLADTARDHCGSTDALRKKVNRILAGRKCWEEAGPCPDWDIYLLTLDAVERLEYLENPVDGMTWEQLTLHELGLDRPADAPCSGVPLPL